LIHLSRTAGESELEKKKTNDNKLRMENNNKMIGGDCDCVTLHRVGSINSIHTCHGVLENYSVVNEDESSPWPVRGRCSVVDVSSSFPSWSLVGFGSRYKLSPAAAFS